MATARRSGRQAGISGPIGDTFKYRASVNYYDTDGFLPSTFLGGKADPVRESLRPGATEFRAERDVLRRRAPVLRQAATPRGFYFVIPRDVEANPFASFTTPPNANDVTSPIQVNNEGVDNRDLFTGAIRLNFDIGGGTLSSVSAYNTTEEIITGDAYDFRPRETSVFTVPAARILRPQPEPVPGCRRRGARNCASPRMTKGACAGSPAPISCTPTGSSPRATWSIRARAYSPCTANRA